MDQYDSLKVGQLRLLCKQRNLSSDGKKEELISRLVESDGTLITLSSDDYVPVTVTSNSMDISTSEPVLSAEDMKEIATVADEIRHIRRQWVRFFSNSYRSCVCVFACIYIRLQYSYTL